MNSQVLLQIPKVLVEFNSIKEEVEIVKADLNLGLAKYEVEIQENLFFDLKFIKCEIKPRLHFK